MSRASARSRVTETDFDASSGTRTEPDDAERVVVCFDMDGVLVDSEDYWHPAERERIFPRVLDGDHPDLDEVTGMNYREIYAYLDEEYETTVDEAEFVDLYDEIADEVYGEEVELLTGAAEFVASLREDGIPVGLVSSAPPAWIDTAVERFGLEFDLIRSAEEFDGPGKPEPGLYEAAIADLGGDPAVVVEDSEHGVRAGAAAGARVVAYRDEHNAESDLSAADEIAEFPEKLIAAVRHATRTIREERSGGSGRSG